MKRSLRILLGGSLLLTLAGCGQVSSVIRTVSGLTGNNSGGTTEVYTAAVEKGTAERTLDLVGNISYNQSADLTWNTNGVIAEVYVKPGDFVRKDDILAELDTDSLDSTVLAAGKTVIDCEEKLEDVMDSDTARMNAYLVLAQKETALKKAKVEQEALYYPRATATDLKIAWDQYALANMNFNYAKQDYDRLVEANAPWDLVGEKMQIIKRTVEIPRIGTFQTAQVINGDEGTSERERKFDEYVLAYNDLVSAYEKYLWTKGKPSDLDYSKAEGNVKAAQLAYDKALEDYLSYGEGEPRAKDVSAALISLHSAETTYEKRYILAPIDGEVTSLSAETGIYVTRGTSALRLDDKSRMFIDISVPEMDLVYMKTGTAVDITVDAVHDRTYSGAITSVADASDTSNNRTAFPAKVEITDPDGCLRSGMTAEVRIVTGTQQDVLYVPNSALSYENDGTYVTVYEGGTQTKTAVIVGNVNGDKTEVKSDSLSAGMKVVISRSSRMPEMPGADAFGSDFGDMIPPMNVDPISAGASVPTAVPTSVPTDVVKPQPTEAPTSAPTDSVKPKPTAAPTAVPTESGMRRPPEGMEMPGGMKPPEGMEMPGGANGGMKPPEGMGMPGGASGSGKTAVPTVTPRPEGFSVGGKG